jgi:hypothetical protein
MLLQFVATSGQDITAYPAKERKKFSKGVEGKKAIV